MRRLRRLVTLLVALAALSASAHAQSADATGRARTHFEAGRALYNLGNFTDAIREFSAGYQLVPKPQFLLNLGQCYRKLDDLVHARELYQKYLAEAPATDADRPQVQQLLVELEKLIKDRPAPPPPLRPVETTRTSMSPSPSSSSRGVNVAPSAALTLTASPPRKRSFLARNWWVLPVGAVVVTGLVVGLYFGLKPADCPATLGCVDVMR